MSQNLVDAREVGAFSMPVEIDQLKQVAALVSH
jgi:hypothetical protein